MAAPGAVAERSSAAFFATAALLWMPSILATVAWCSSMAQMPGMSMAGGWTMSMAWMRMPGQSWLGAFASFVGMWSVMMVAMMTPVLAPFLERCRAGVFRGSRTILATRTASFVLGYFGAWTLAGVAIFPFGAAFAELAMQVPAVARVVPLATGLVVCIAGALQLTRSKQRQLRCCRQLPCAGSSSASIPAAWRAGLRLGIRCMRCCAGLTAILLVAGVMDLRAMLLVTCAIALERLAPAGEQVAKATGVLLLLVGTLLLLPG